MRERIVQAVDQVNAEYVAACIDELFHLLILRTLRTGCIPNCYRGIIRTENAVATLESKGITLEKLSYGIANWNRPQAQNRMTQMLGEHKDQIELVLANNDDMVLGDRLPIKEDNWYILSSCKIDDLRRRRPVYQVNAEYVAAIQSSEEKHYFQKKMKASFL